MFPVHLITIPPRHRLQLLAEKSPMLRQSNSLPDSPLHCGAFPDNEEFPRIVANYRDSTPSSHSWSSNDEERLNRNQGHQAKKHVCTECYKRFNRPSSLRIHENTHTGLTPFRCPYPGCGRRFNVSSNMRRHYRKHDFPPTAMSYNAWSSKSRM
ncbi:hypothetical protein GYMLUDRAFT_48183 [Collybiopsis luxurians FD-317 M1]|uniref:C2H2-type domain-containing protein n=1 Tax=Collybiopsis luxurians FD-317 M1 TaxID=944289 RepID=A0A0D0AWQ4_9AGAR|nr:hypothetical protein GYMLUDRAFT_48183 [Collybiopsis luxurians FD-317 M1]